MGGVQVSDGRVFSQSSRATVLKYWNGSMKRILPTNGVISGSMTRLSRSMKL